MIVSLSGCLATALTVAVATESAGLSQQAPDLVLLGGKVFTSDTARLCQPTIHRASSCQAAVCPTANRSGPETSTANPPNTLIG